MTLTCVNSREGDKVCVLVTESEHVCVCVFLLRLRYCLQVFLFGCVLGVETELLFAGVLCFGCWNWAAVCRCFCLKLSCCLQVFLFGCVLGVETELLFTGVSLPAHQPRTQLQRAAWVQRDPKPCHYQWGGGLDPSGTGQRSPGAHATRVSQRRGLGPEDGSERSVTAFVSVDMILMFFTLGCVRVKSGSKGCGRGGRGTVPCVHTVVFLARTDWSAWIHCALQLCPNTCFMTGMNVCWPCFMTGVSVCWPCFMTGVSVCWPSFMTGVSVCWPCFMTGVSVCWPCFMTGVSGAPFYLFFMSDGFYRGQWVAVNFLTCVLLLLLLFVLLRKKYIAQSREMAQDMSQKREDLTYKEKMLLQYTLSAFSLWNWWVFTQCWQHQGYSSGSKSLEKMQWRSCMKKQCISAQSWLGWERTRKVSSVRSNGGRIQKIVWTGWVLPRVGLWKGH